MLQRTLTIIKPDALGKGHAGGIISMLERAGFKIVAARLVHMTQRQAEGFYAVHREREFFGDLTRFMSSGPCLPMVLERENAIDGLRALMGATNPAEAAEGTIRRLYATDIEKNGIHGSDSPASAATEIPYFFPGIEVLPG
jgi:nucleoside-diphosphate kinase